MTWQLPSLAALRTFEAAARHMSFTKAAAELHLTQSAVSRQIRTMEEYLGVMLFQRVKQRLVLTEVGRNYLISIRSALEKMQEATVNLLAHRGRGGMLVLATPPAFATKWLIPRLAEFYKRNPQIVINLVTRTKPFDFAVEPIDVAIHYGSSDWPGVVSVKLMGDDVEVVCSPSYAASHPSMRTPQDIAQHILLQQSTRPHLWHDWMGTRGITMDNAWSGPRFEHFYMMMQAAVGGLGVALLPRILVEDELNEGRLIIPFDGSHKSRDAYHFVCPPEKQNDPKIEIFRRWLSGQSA